MEYINTKDGLRLLGQGQARVLAVQSGIEDTHKVKIEHPDFGQTEFIPYVQTAGVFKVPAIGDIVYVFCREGFSRYPMAWGTKLHKSAVQALLGSRDNRATVIYSTGADHKTISHTIILDDGEDRGIRIKTAGGNFIDLKDTDQIEISQINGNTIVMDSSGIKLTREGSTITMTPNDISINTGVVNITANEINMEASGSTLKIDSTINGKASDDQSTFDKVVISTHDHVAGNLGFPTTLGPTKTGS